MADPKNRALSLLSGPVGQIPTGGYPVAPAPATPSPAEQALADARAVGLQAVASPQTFQGMQDAAGRGVASLLGAPIDLAAMVLVPAGYNHPAPVAGSEWIGQQMEQAGLISPVRRPAAELLASVPNPAGVAKTGFGVVAAISPEGKARLLADLTAGKSSGTYRLGDVSQGQANALQRLGMPPTNSRDVMMTDASFNHLADARMVRDGFQPDEVVRFAKQAMEPRSNVVRDPTGAGHKPALANDGLLDPASQRRYTAQMPLRVVDGQMEVVSVVPRGLPGKKKKAP